jgi:hypothetical protein
LTDKGKPDPKESVKQTYLRIMEFVYNAPHIKTALENLGLRATPLTQELGQILEVARDANLVASFTGIFEPLINKLAGIDGGLSEKLERRCLRAFKKTCKNNPLVPLRTFVDCSYFLRENFALVPLLKKKPAGDTQPSLAEVVSFVHFFINNSPKILEQKKVPISITARNMTALPPEVCLFHNITGLDLADNRLTALPPEIGQLNRLKTIDLACNKFTTFPEIICDLSELKSFNFGNPSLGVNPLVTCQNRLSHLPETISRLNKLEFLGLYKNQLTQLPEGIFKLTNLVAIDIRQNEIKASELKTIFKRLKALPWFNIKKCQKWHVETSKCSVQ